MARPAFADFRDPMLNLNHPWKLFELCELDEVMRQRGDERFIDLLNNIRIGKLSNDDDELLKTRIIAKDSECYPHDAIHIWAENEPVREYNNTMLGRLTSPLYIINALDNYPKQVAQSSIDRALDRSQMETGGLSQVLQIKVGARVMITANIDVAEKLCNGQIGVVHFVKHDVCGNVIKIYVKFDDETVGRKQMNSDNFAKQHKCVPIKRHAVDIKICKSKPSSPVIKRAQFPLMLAWACTVHKVQGNQFQKIVVSFELRKQRRFNPGQIYVALSRVTSLEGLYIIGRYHRNAIVVDERVTREYERMRRDCPMTPISSLPSSDPSVLHITLLNTRSLNKHYQDIKCDKYLVQSDVICLTETQIKENQNTEKISKAFDDFKITYNNDSHRYSSLAVLLKKPLELVTCTAIPNMLMFSIKKEEFSNQPVYILLIYKKQEMSTQSLCEILTYFVNSENNLQIVLGDFNINAFEENGDNHMITSALRNFKLVVNEPTHISGSLIDHVYVRESFLQEVSFNSVIKNTYFSDHDAFQISFCKKITES